MQYSVTFCGLPEVASDVMALGDVDLDVRVRWDSSRSNYSQIIQRAHFFEQHTNYAAAHHFMPKSPSRFG